MTDKTHARDYLLELAEGDNTPGWLRDLIIRLVNSNGQLTDEDITATTEQLKANGVGSLPLPTTAATDTATEISLTELIHHGGVNALASEQHIPFSKDITLLYGENGTGKSSYFRVLNEIAGGNREIHIHHNIFSSVKPPFDVELKFLVKGSGSTVHGDEEDEWEERTLRWNGTGRGIAPLTQASVFDSDYTDALLEKRSADTAIVQPLGLHLFRSLTTAMETIREKLGTEAEGVRRTLPQIAQDNLSADVKNVLNQRDYTSLQQQYITERYGMNEEQEEALKTCEAQYKQLTATDYDVKIKLAQNEQEMVKGLKDHLQNCLNTLQQHEKSVTELYGHLKEARKAQEEARLKIRILGEIGNTGSAEWRAFIQSGAAFKAKATIEAGVCPYCRQPLEGDTKTIVQAYADYLNDQTAKVYDGYVKQKSQLLIQIGRVVTKYTISEPLTKILDAQENSAEVKEYVGKCLGQLEAMKKSLLDSFEKEVYEPVFFPKGNGQLGTICKNYEAAIEKLRTEKAGRDEKLAALKGTRDALLERKAIATQKEKWAEWFTKMSQIRELERGQGKISTRNVSILAKAASQHLLTDSLREKFQEELNALKMEYLRVTLDEAGAKSGQSYMKISLDANVDTREILSEGEQKGVALALFVAERRMEHLKNPIILDDPVNSLDHHITACFVERLVELGNQVIIFSHNILLRDSLLALNAVHVCTKQEIGSCGKQSKHLFVYNVKTRTTGKGHIREAKKDNAKFYIESARKVLQKPDFDDDIDMGTCCGLLRHAIELLVDEKVFCNLTPVKYRGGKNQTIIWDRLKQLQANPAMIDQLHEYYNRLSGGDLHLGRESRENPVDVPELNVMIAQLLVVNG